jgi:hypothetical protein
MLQRLGNVVYWTACGVALLVVFFALFIGIRGEVVSSVELLVFAGLIWLAGKVARYVLVG